MKDSAFELEMNDIEKDTSFDMIQFVKRYLAYWPYFLISLFLALGIGYLYLRYAPINYASVAKIKIIDDANETDIAKDPLSMVWSDSKINMDNEIAVLQSYRLLSEVVDSLGLNIGYYHVGTIKTSEIWNAPFKITETINRDSINQPLSFYVELEVSGFKITDTDDKEYQVPYFQTDTKPSVLPFNIMLSEETVVNEHRDRRYLVKMFPFKQSVLSLTNALSIQTLNKKSEILALSMVGESPLKSESVLNTVIGVFNKDGVNDRQQVSKRTLEFIDERFGYLTQELDSIEGGKQNFKTANNLSYIEADAGNSLVRKSETEEDVNQLETQISLAKDLKRTVVNQAQYMLLPVNIGLENSSLNALVGNYNDMALEREKLLTSVGESHPTLVTISSQLERAKVNILKTVSVYEGQLRTSLNGLMQEKNRASSIFSNLPEKEKRLRAIERQQSIKENLFLLLLQKREEAAINLAVTAPSVKVVDFGLTDVKPISPKRMIVMGVAGLLGLFLPFAFFYVRFAMDTTVQERSDFENSTTTIPLLSEIPHFKDHKLFVDVNDRSLLSESFRILATNIKYVLAKESKGIAQTIFVTSADMGEGKTLISHNLAVAFASMNKKTLLVGADLRSPQLHAYFGKAKNAVGLTDFLQAPTLALSEILFHGSKQNNLLDVCLSGSLPHNAPQLLTSGGFDLFMTMVKPLYDLIIVDTAPTGPVTDTFLIAENADVTLYVLRAGVTDKKVLQSSNTLKRQGRLQNMGYIFNDVSSGNTKNYSYGYGDTT